jgi:hypothetical protein
MQADTFNIPLPTVQPSFSTLTSRSSTNSQRSSSESEKNTDAFTRSGNTSHLPNDKKIARNVATKAPPELSQSRARSHGLLADQTSPQTVSMGNLSNNLRTKKLNQGVPMTIDIDSD